MYAAQGPRRALAGHLVRRAGSRSDTGGPPRTETISAPPGYCCRAAVLPHPAIAVGCGTATWETRPTRLAPFHTLWSSCKQCRRTSCRSARHRCRRCASSRCSGTSAKYIRGAIQYAEEAPTIMPQYDPNHAKLLLCLAMMLHE